MIIIFFGKTQSTQNDAHETNQTAQPPQLSHTKQLLMHQQHDIPETRSQLAQFNIPVAAMQDPGLPATDTA